MVATFNLQQAVRPNIWALEPYRSGRDDYPNDGRNVLLDANENAIGSGLTGLSGLSDPASAVLLNRYPDPHQPELKQLWCDLRQSDCLHGARPDSQLQPQHVFLGVGSDEAIDGLMRCFCRPGHDAILVCPPTYGMYAVAAAVNDVAVMRVPLGPPPHFSLDLPAVLAAAANRSIKLIFLCSPGNPTGASLAVSDVAVLLVAAAARSQLVVLDEAYVDFAVPRSSLAAAVVVDHPNLVVLQTLSKAWGLAALRVGAAFAPSPVARLLNRLKAPYNLSGPAVALARRALADPVARAAVAANLVCLRAQRDRLVAELPRIAGIGRRRGGLDANFVLYEVLAPTGRPDVTMAREAHRRLAVDRHVVVRFRGTEPGCDACLRITVGTEQEVTRLLAELASVLAELWAESARDPDAESLPQ